MEGDSSSLRPGLRDLCKMIYWPKLRHRRWAESKFRSHEELIVLNILKCKYCVNKSRDHFTKNCKSLTNWWPV